MKNEEQIALGFSSMEEMQLYRDVCLGRDKPLNGKNYEKFLYEIETKKGCIKVIEDFALNDIFYEVKDMPRVDRLIHLYNYNANIASMCRGFNTQVDLELNEDNEKIQEQNLYLKKITINQYKRLATHVCFTIYDIAMKELNSNDKKQFIDMIEGIDEIKNMTK